MRILTRLVPFQFAVVAFAAQAAAAATQPQANVSSPTHPESRASIENAPWVWRNIGPNHLGGIVTDVAMPVFRNRGEPRTGTIIYVAGVGGLFKTVDGGVRWKPLLDDAPSSTVNCVVVAPSDPNVLWVGTGTSTQGFEPHAGHGVFKSTDGGTTWENAGFQGVDHIGSIAIDPADANTVFVGVDGSVNRATRERGIYKTVDGGRTWTQVHFVNEWTGVPYVVIDPKNPRNVYAATWQRALNPNHIWVDYGEGSGLWKSTDGGATWRRLTSGLPAGPFGRIGVTVSPASPNILYAVLDLTRVSESILSRDGGGRALYVSTDYGETWRAGGGSQRMDYVNVGSYFGKLWADPVDAGRVYIANNAMTESSDTGRTLTDIPDHPHADPHALWIDPDNPAHVVMGNDRGVFISETRLRHWRHIESLALARVLTVSADAVPFFYKVYATIMDSWPQVAPSRSRHGFGILMGEWRDGSGGENGMLLADPNDTTVQYEVSGWHITRYSTRTEMRTKAPFFSPTDQSPRSGYVMSNDRPAAIPSRHFPHVIYRGSDRVWKVSDRGMEWEPISPRLTHPIPDSATIMGQFDPDWALTLAKRGRLDALIRFKGEERDRGGITAVAESRRDAGVLYAGTKETEVHVTRNGGRSWQRTAALPGAPAGAWISSLWGSAHDPAVAYASAFGVELGDRRPYVFKTRDYGQHWTPISKGLPEDASVWAIVEHFRTPGLLFVGTDQGVHVSLDDGVTWARLEGNLPRGARVRSLLIQEAANDLVLGVWGRGIWILDDLGPLEDWSRASSSAEPYLFRIGTALRYPVDVNTENNGTQRYSAPNPPRGALISYFVPQRTRPARDTIDIMNDRGELVRSFETDTAVGFHRFAWDLRWSNLGGSREVKPGRYVARMRQSRVIDARYFEVRRDPALGLSSATEDTIDADAKFVTVVRDDLRRFEGVARQLIAQLDSAEGMLRRSGAPDPLLREVLSVRDSAFAILDPITRTFRNAEEAVAIITSTDTTYSGVLEWFDEDKSPASTSPVPPRYRALAREAQTATERQRSRLVELLEGPVRRLEAALRLRNRMVPLKGATLLRGLLASSEPIITRARDYKAPIQDKWSVFVDPRWK